MQKLNYDVLIKSIVQIPINKFKMKNIFMSFENM